MFLVNKTALVSQYFTIDITLEKLSLFYYLFTRCLLISWLKASINKLLVFLFLYLNYEFRKFLYWRRFSNSFCLLCLFPDPLNLQFLHSYRLMKRKGSLKLSFKFLVKYTLDESSLNVSRQTVSRRNVGDSVCITYSIKIRFYKGNIGDVS